MDEADLANEKAEQFAADALRQICQRAEQPPSTGICRSCGETIEPERLAVNPTAHLCRDCAIEEEEARKKAHRLGAG